MHAIGVVMGWWPLEQNETGGLPDGNTITRDVERPAWARRVQTQCMKSIKRCQAQRVGATDDRRVTQTCRDHARRITESFGGGGAGTGNYERWSGEAEPGREISREGSG